MKRVCIVIPAYNEEKRIGKTLEDYGAYFNSKKITDEVDDFMILVVLNACKDRTLDVVKIHEKYNKNIIHLEFEQGGKGFAIVEGFNFAIRNNFDFIGFVDADESTPPESFYDLILSLKNAHGAIADRWNKKSIIKTKQTILRRFISRGFNFIVRSLFLLSYRDTQCGAKIFRRGILEKVVPKLGSSEWSFDIDLLFYMRREKARIKSVPTVWEDKKESKLNLKKTPTKMFCSVIRLRLVHSPFKFVVKMHSKLPERFKVSSLIEKIK